ncbi:MAG: LysM peptidoglycan-binding domain-containing protein, partial [Opitutales bacterium]|nr:LysM peptidoglycan-binding domain-containing protein [Opitutales bacterium]
MSARRQFLRRLLLGSSGLLLAQPFLLRGQSDSVHIVQAGDTLSHIAVRYGMSVSELRRLNGLQTDRINVGQTLVVRNTGTATITYTVRRGDTLGAIAARFGVSIADIQRANGLRGSRILVGQTLNIPNQPQGLDTGTSYIQNVIEVTNRLQVPRGRWQYIVGHHSATENGNAASYDRYHREERRMENGLAYHFVIGNGRASGRGEVEIGNRWIRQLQGGHVRNHDVNMSGIGICLVGNFENRAPFPEQTEAFI